MQLYAPCLAASSLPKTSFDLPIGEKTDGVIFILGPGNVHFDHGQDIYFIKRTKNYPAAGDRVTDAERRLVSIFFALDEHDFRPKEY